MPISTLNVAAPQGRVEVAAKRELEIARLLKEGFECRGNYSKNSKGIPGTNLTIFVENEGTSDFASSLARFISKHGAENVRTLDSSIWVRKEASK